MFVQNYFLLFNALAAFVHKCLPVPHNLFFVRSYIYQNSIIMYTTIIKQAVIVMLLTAANAVVAISLVNILRLSGML